MPQIRLRSLLHLLPPTKTSPPQSGGLSAWAAECWVETTRTYWLTFYSAPPVQEAVPRTQRRSARGGAHPRHQDGIAERSVPAAIAGRPGGGRGIVAPGAHVMPLLVRRGACSRRACRHHSYDHPPPSNLARDFEDAWRSESFTAFTFKESNLLRALSLPRADTRLGSGAACEGRGNTAVWQSV